MRGQVLLMLSLAVYYAVLLKLIGLGRDSGGDFDRLICDYSVFGLWLGFVLATLTALLQFGLNGSVLFGAGRLRYRSTVGKLCVDAASGG